MKSSLVTIICLRGKRFSSTWALKSQILGVPKYISGEGSMKETKDIYKYVSILSISLEGPDSVKTLENLPNVLPIFIELPI